MFLLPILSECGRECVGECYASCLYGLKLSKGVLMMCLWLLWSEAVRGCVEKCAC